MWMPMTVQVAVQVTALCSYIISVSNPVYTDTGIPVFGTPNTDTDTGKKWPVFAYTPYYWFLPCS
jgi:hypothetical protein